MVKRLSWIFLAFLGAWTAYVAHDTLEMGTVINIGSAVYPLILSCVIFVIAVFGIIVGDKQEPHPLNLRGIVGVVSSVLIFIAVVEHIGLIPTVIASMLAAYLGQSETKYGFFILYAVLFAIGVWLLFTQALGLPLPAVRMP